MAPVEITLSEGPPNPRKRLHLDVGKVAVITDYVNGSDKDPLDIRVRSLKDDSGAVITIEEHHKEPEEPPGQEISRTTLASGESHEQFITTRHKKIGHPTTYPIAKLEINHYVIDETIGDEITDDDDLDDDTIDPTT